MSKRKEKIRFVIFEEEDVVRVVPIENLTQEEREALSEKKDETFEEILESLKEMF